MQHEVEEEGEKEKRKSDRKGVRKRMRMAKEVLGMKELHPGKDQVSSRLSLKKQMSSHYGRSCQASGTKRSIRRDEEAVKK